MSHNQAEIHQPHNKKWRQVIEDVEKANLDKIEQIKWQSIMRKKAYCSQLDQQVSQRRQTKLQKQQQKVKERSQLSKQIKLQRQAKVSQRVKKMRTQQKYGQQNIKLINDSEKHKKHSNQNPGQHPFVKLVDKQRERKRETMKKFQFQNHLNTIQSQMKEESRRRQKQLQRHERKIFQQHVQQQFKKKAQERQNFRQKYLKVQRYSSPHQRTHSTIDNSRHTNQYLAYLQNQADDQRQSRRRNQYLDEKMLKIHKHTKQVDSSPAYLGRNTQSTDRKKQFQYIDRSLHLDNYRQLLPYPSKNIKRNEQFEHRKLNELAQSIQRKKQNHLPVLPKRRQTQLSNFDNDLLNAKEKAFFHGSTTSPNQITANQQLSKNKINPESVPTKINYSVKTQQKQVKTPLLRSISPANQLVGQRISVIQTNKKIRQPNNQSLVMELKERRSSGQSNAESVKSRSFFRYDFISGVNRSYVL